MFTRRALVSSIAFAPFCAKALDFDALPLKIHVAEADEMMIALVNSLISLDKFKSVGLTVELVIVPKGVAFATLKKNDIALTDLNALLLAKGRGELSHLKVIMGVVDRPNFAIIGRRSRGIESLESLEGKMVGSPLNELSLTYFPSLLALKNIDSSKIKIETIGANLREPMLASGELDAALGASCAMIAALKERSVPQDDIITVSYQALGCMLYGAALIVSDSLILEQRDALIRLKGAISLGLTEFRTNAMPFVEALRIRRPTASLEGAAERVTRFMNEAVFTDFITKNGVGSVDLLRFEAALKQLAFEAPYVAKPTLENTFNLL